MSSLRDRFRSVKDGIADTWSGLTNAISRPIANVSPVSQTGPTMLARRFSPYGRTAG